MMMNWRWWQWGIAKASSFPCFTTCVRALLWSRQSPLTSYKLSRERLTPYNHKRGFCGGSRINTFLLKSIKPFGFFNWWRVMHIIQESGSKLFELVLLAFVLFEVNMMICLGMMELNRNYTWSDGGRLASCYPAKSIVYFFWAALVDPLAWLVCIEMDACHCMVERSCCSWTSLQCGRPMSWLLTLSLLWAVHNFVLLVLKRGR